MLLFEKMLENGKYLIYIAVLSTFVASIGTFIWGAYLTYLSIKEIIVGISHSSVEASAGIQMIAILDAFLLATILYIFAVALYELFLGDLNVPEWLVINNLDDLKMKLVNVIILIMAVTFLEHLSHWEHAEETLMFGIAIAVVLFALVYFSQLTAKHAANKSNKDGH